MNIEKRIKELEIDLKNNDRKYHNSKIITNIGMLFITINIIYSSYIMNSFYDILFIGFFILLLIVDYLGKIINNHYIEITQKLIDEYKNILTTD